MDDGVIQFLVIAFFIVISLMDGAARKRRKAAQGQGPLVDVNRLPGAEDDFSEAADPSERVLPKDVWGEIAALARGEESTSLQEPPPTRAIDTHRDPAHEDEEWTAPQEDVLQWHDPKTEGGATPRTQSPSRHLTVTPSQDMTVRPTEEWDAVVQGMTRSGDLQGGYLHPDQAASHEEHGHEKHAVVASPSRPLPAERPHEFVAHSRELPSEPQKVPGRARKPGTLLSQFKQGGKDSLREAIVLAEVLGPPVTLRDSGWKPLF